MTTTRWSYGRGFSHSGTLRESLPILIVLVMWLVEIVGGDRDGGVGVDVMESDELTVCMCLSVTVVV